jgi:ubiquinone/menaquinone biosynthesis C-methylase UbiE
VSHPATGVPTGNTYDKYATSNPIERRLVGGFLDRLDRLLPARPPGRVLEVGTGEGEVASRVAQRFPDAWIGGLDLPDPALAAHWRSRGLAGAFGDITALPFPSGSFDLVLAIEVLEHVPDPTRALHELARVARDDVIVSVPWEPLWRVANVARGKYVRSLGNTPGHVQHWTRRGFVGLVGSVFEVTGVHNPPPWTIVSARVRP